MGSFLVVQFLLNKKIHKITIATLVFFICLNLYDLIVSGNDVNCGCMGMAYSFSPLASILKNCILLILVFTSLKFSVFEFRVGNEWLRYLFIFIPFTIIFIWQPIYVYDDPAMPLKGKKIDFSIMNGHKGFKGKTYTEDLAQGKKIVAFLSITCVHCKVAGYKLTGYKAANPQLPIYFIMNGDSINMPSFSKVVGGQNIPKAHFNGKDDFASMSGYHLPAIVLLNNGVVEAQYNAESLNKTSLENWMRIVE